MQLFDIIFRLIEVLVIGFLGIKFARQQSQIAKMEYDIHHKEAQLQLLVRRHRFFPGSPTMEYRKNGSTEAIVIDYLSGIYSFLSVDACCLMYYRTSSKEEPSFLIRLDDYFLTGAVVGDRDNTVYSAFLSNNIARFSDYHNEFYKLNNPIILTRTVLVKVSYKDFENKTKYMYYKTNASRFTQVDDSYENWFAESIEHIKFSKLNSEIIVAALEKKGIVVSSSQSSECGGK